MVSMIVAIIILTILLKRRKCNDNEYKVFPTANTSTSLAIDKAEYQRQDSGKELGSLKLSPNYQSDCESVKVDDSFVNNSRGIRNMSHLEITSSTNEVNLPPRKRAPVPANVILPEQMKAICRDVLNKRSAEDSTSSRNITEMMQEFNKLDRSPTIRDNGVIEKSMSTPELDIYDCPPSRKYEERNEMDDEDIDMPVYDSLPSPYKFPKNNNVVVDLDSQYLLPLSGPANQEPCYINANKNNYIL